MNILMLTPFPFAKPQHGGQLRCANIFAAYRRAGHRVQALGCCYCNPYQEGYVGDFSPQLIKKFSRGYDVFNDYAPGEALFEDDNLFEELASYVDGQPDLIDVEHPWLFRFAKRLRQEKFHAHVPIMYSSHNIEFAMKRKILNTIYKEHGKEAEDVLAEIKALEIEVVQQADGVMCVSEQDLQWSCQYTDRKILLAPNGVSAWQSNREERKAVRELVGGEPFALFCGSGHPPNVIGFFDMLEGAFGSMNTGQYLVIAGGVGDGIKWDGRLEACPKLKERIMPLGIIEQGRLDALRDLAHVIILPITQGGGTNLKTAEALWSGHYVVSTTTAMRGFEQFKRARGVFVADTPGEFKRAIRKAMELPPLRLKPAEVNARRTVLWESCLSGLAEYAEQVVQGI